MSSDDPTRFIPHRPPMLLLDSVRFDGHARSVTALAVIREDNPFVRDGSMRTVALIEHMAQAAAACVAEQGERGEAPRPGWVVAVPLAEFHVATIEVGDQLLVVARHAGGDDEAARFEAEVQRDETAVARASLTVYRGQP